MVWREDPKIGASESQYFAGGGLKPNWDRRDLFREGRAEKDAWPPGRP